jgi:hypothetical protein
MPRSAAPLNSSVRSLQRRLSQIQWLTTVALSRRGAFALSLQQLGLRRSQVFQSLWLTAAPCGLRTPVSSCRSSTTGLRRFQVSWPHPHMAYRTGIFCVSVAFKLLYGSNLTIRSATATCRGDNPALSGALTQASGAYHEEESMEPIYDRSGRVAAWTRGNDIYNFDGSHAAVLNGPNVYGHRGQHWAFSATVCLRQSRWRRWIHARGYWRRYCPFYR